MRHQIKQTLKDVGVRAVVRLMRWADPEMASGPEGSRSRPNAEEEEEAAVEAELEEALTRSEHIATSKPKEDVFVYAEATPNPNAMKFTVSVPILPSGSLSFSNAEQASGNKLGSRLFEIEGVEGIFAVNDFCTITKASEVNWSQITTEIENVLVENLGH